MESNLKLLETEPKEKKKSWLQERIDLFLDRFKESTGKKCPMPYGQLIGLLSNKANDSMNGWGILNIETGEIEKNYPDMDVWEGQVKAFFQDEFAGQKAGFSFGYFLKQFGTFEKFDPKKRKESDPVLVFTCSKCRHELKSKKSFWSKFKNQTGKCSDCGERFSVNDVLNQIPSFDNLLERQ